jgi:ribosomal-protein-alanine N-acetyltransferase
MRFPFWQTARDYVLEPLLLDDADDIAILHEEDFARPWSGSEFRALLEDRTVFGFAAREFGRGKDPPVGFVIARRAAGEAEILTVAVARASRRAGIGWMLMDAVLRQLHAERAEALFLEVDETNVAAIALYRRLGFHQVGTRRNYYHSPAGAASSALVMRRDLR